MKNKINDIIKSLSQRDIEALRSIYLYRCLTLSQIYELHYMESLRTKKVMSDEVAKKKIREFLTLGLIEQEEYTDKGESGINNGLVYFITPDGIEVIRYCFDIPTNIYDSTKMVIKRGYYRAYELKLHPKLINHQIHLNQFVIDFQIKASDVSWKYFDEKYVSQYTNIRPDGMISMDDIDFFIEMDMSTESKKQLYEKWENYRNFLISREYSYKEKRIVVLFIVDGLTNLEERKNVVKYTIYERLLDKIDADFEIYVGTKEELIELMFTKLIPLTKGVNIMNEKLKNIFETKHGFNVDNGEVLKNIFEGTEYGLYIRKVNENKNIIFENNRIQEFIVDEYSHTPVSVLSKVSYVDKNNTFFKHKFNREISLIVVAQTEQEIYNDLRLVDLIGVKNVYFSTFSRLENMPFHEALFQFDFLGNIHHFANNGLNERVFERTM